MVKMQIFCQSKGGGTFGCFEELMTVESLQISCQVLSLITPVMQLIAKRNYHDQIEEQMDSAYSMNGKDSNAYWVLVGKTKGKRPLGRPRHTWADNNKWILDLYVVVVWTALV
jgi:hypothetical protein